MTSRADLRTILRRDKLKDTDATRYKWSDDTVDEAIKDAMRDYSQHFPRRMRTTITHGDTVESYALPTDFKSEAYLVASDGVRYKALTPGEWEQSKHSLEEFSGGLTSQNFIGGDDYYDADQGLYTIWGNTLYITPMPDDDLVMYYFAWHNFTDAAVSSVTVPEEDLDLIVLYAHAVCLVRDSSSDATLSRWDEGSGRRDDNPVEFLSTRLFNAYRQKILERKAARENRGF